MKVRIATVQITVNELMTGPELYAILSEVDPIGKAILDVNVASVTAPIDHHYDNSLLVDERERHVPV